MRIGKLSNEELEQLVIRKIQYQHPDVLIHSGVGEDCSVIDYGDEVCVVSSDPITGASHQIGKLAIDVACNDIASTGAEALGVMMVMLAPSSTTKEELAQVMREATDEAARLRIEILGGHTEVTDAVNRMVLVMTVIGKERKSQFESNSQPVATGDWVVISKEIGLEGTAILAHDREEWVAGKIDAAALALAKAQMDRLSVLEEGRIGAKIGFKYMHDITEGGVLGACWEASQATGRGLKIEREVIPLLSVTQEIAALFEIDPYSLISSGSMLAVVTPAQGEKWIAEGERQGLRVTKIGQVQGDQPTLLEADGSICVIASPEADALYTALARHKEEIK
jgi:hydrogenase expression/formation protein HypE